MRASGGYASQIGVLLACLFVLLLPKSYANLWREQAEAVTAPIANLLSRPRLPSLFAWALLNSKARPKIDENALIAKLQLENLQLGHRADNLEHLLALQRETNQLLELSEEMILPVAFASGAAKAWIDELRQLYSMALPANVIFRSPNSWYSTLWINQGYASNQGIQKIERNSPVVIGLSLVGVVDFVGAHASRIRLISDSALVPSVKVARGYPQNLELLAHIDHLLDSLATREDLVATLPNSTLIYEQLETLRMNLLNQKEGMRLAKGEIRGSGKPLWRKAGHLLKGAGFNYDFEDEDGPARDLRSGMPLASHASTQTLPLIQLDDLLVTTGMDGVFPRGLHVAKVTRILPLAEGAYTYDIEAEPTAGTLTDLSLVWVLPPLGIASEDVKEASAPWRDL